MNRPVPPFYANGDGKLPPTPKPFHIDEPFCDRGLWCFWLTADEEALHYVGHLSCVLSMSYPGRPFIRRPATRALIEINPRYDHQEAWLWICELLESETRNVELEDAWEAAIELACAGENEDFS